VKPRRFVSLAIRRGILPGPFRRTENSDEPAEIDVPAKTKIAVTVHWRI
jgi:hypothetical protein